MAILGGAKVSDKIDVIENLLTRVQVLDRRRRDGLTRSSSRWATRSASPLVEEDKLTVAKEILERAEQREVKVLLPIDHVVSQSLDEGRRVQGTVEVDGIPPDWMAVDIGPKDDRDVRSGDQGRGDHRLERTDGRLRKTPTSPRGRFSLAKVVAESDSVSIVGRRATRSQAVKKAGVADRISHISTWRRCEPGVAGRQGAPGAWRLWIVRSRRSLVHQSS